MANVMDGEDMCDMHMCLVCHTTVIGLVNYINHKKYDCPGKKLMPPATENTTVVSSNSSQAPSTKPPSGYNDEFAPTQNSSFSTNTHGPQHYTGSYRHNIDPAITQNEEQNDSVATNLMPSVANDKSEIHSAEGILKAAMIASGVVTSNSSLQSFTNSKTSCSYGNSGQVGIPQSSTFNSVSNATSISVDIQDSFSGLTSDMFSPGATNAIDPNIVMSSHNPEDFFSSLALQSKSSLKEQQLSAQNAVNSILNQVHFDKETGTNVNDNIANDLPISNILNNLNFNSDDEDMNFTFCDDDFFEEAFSGDSDSDDDSHPPRHHTSGKWKPGQGPPHSSGGKWKPGLRSLQSAGSKWSSVPPRQHTGGKWKPGQGPGHTVGGKWRSTLSQSSNKLKLSVITKKPVVKPKKNANKLDTYFCKACNLSLKNRFAYSSHCASQKHKENVVIGVTHVSESNNNDELPTEVFSVNSVFCSACNLFLKNRFAYSSHCASRKHKENVVTPVTESDSIYSVFCYICNVQLKNQFAYSSHCRSQYHQENLMNGVINNEKSVNEAEDNGVPDENVVAKLGEKRLSENKDVLISCDNDQKAGDFDNEQRADNSDEEHTADGDMQFGNETESLSVKVPYNEEEHNFEKEKCEQGNGFNENIEKEGVTTVVDENHFDSETDNEDNVEELMDGNKTPEKENEQDHNDKEKIDEESKDKNMENVEEDETKNEVKEEPISVLVCCICDQKFYSKYVLARHFLSQYHLNRAKNHADTIKVLEDYHKYIIRLSPFQCLVCRYYFNREEDLVKHLSSPEHQNLCEDSTAPLFCTACKFVSHWNSEVIEHLSTNKQHIEAMKKRNRPCIVKERHFQAKCKYCSKVLHSHVHMKHHVRTKHGKDIYLNECLQKNICRLCSEQFKSVSALKLHMTRLHLTPGQVFCQVCNKVMKGKIDYKKHLKSEKHKLLFSKYQTVKNMTKLRKAAGVINNLKFGQGEANLLIRSPKVRKNDQSEDKVYKCEYCDFVVNKYSDLRPHYIEKHSKHVLVCDICDLTFISEKARKLHYASKQHQSNLEKVEEEDGATKVMKCPLCPRKFSDEGLKNFHVEVYHAHPSNEDRLQMKLGGPCYTSKLYEHFLLSIEFVDKSRKVPCPEKTCGKEVKKENMLEHLRLHSGDKPFKCRYCSCGFISTSTLRRHLTSHLGLQQRKCEICGKEYKKIASYKEHMQQHELEKNQAQKLMCDVCGQSFYLKRQLQSHMRRHGERKFKCTVEGCHWTFYFATELNFHMRSHTREKPYLCDLCGYAAATKNRLLRHSRTHSGERLHHCEYCTYKAGTSTHLRRHMRIHIGCKPYKCPYCSYSCNTHENVRKHIMKTKKHSGLFIYPCKFCSYATNAVTEFKSHLMNEHSDRVEITSNDSMAQYTGLYQPQEDPRKPTEGMKINPIKERKRHLGKPKNIKNKPKIKVYHESEDNVSSSDTEEHGQNNEHSYSRDDEINPAALDGHGHKNHSWVPPTHYSGTAPVISSVMTLAPQSAYFGMDLPQSAAHYYGADKTLHDRNGVPVLPLENYPKLVIDEFRDTENKKTSHFGVNLINLDNH